MSGMVGERFRFVVTKRAREVVGSNREWVCIGTIICFILHQRLGSIASIRMDQQPVKLVHSVHNI
jgi:hypothetical protein